MSTSPTPALDPGAATIVFVPGIPVAQGSHRAFVIGGKPRITASNAKPLTLWRARIGESVGACMREHGELCRAEIGFSLMLRFTFLRPAAHFGAGKHADRLKHGAPQRHLKSPDLDKLIRAVLDGLTGVLFADDKQVDNIIASREYSERPGVQVTWSNGETK